MSFEKWDHAMNRFEKDLELAIRAFLKNEYGIKNIDDKDSKRIYELAKKMMSFDLSNEDKKIKDKETLELLEKAFKNLEENLSDKKEPTKTQEEEEEKMKKIYQEFIDIDDLFDVRTTQTDLQKDSTDDMVDLFELFDKGFYSFGDVLEEVQMGTKWTREGWESDELYIFMETVKVDDTEQDLLFINIDGEIRQYIPDNVDLFSYDWKMIK